MKLAEIIAQINTIPELSGKVEVGMPAQLEHIGNTPYCWITNVGETGGDSPITGPVRQRVVMTMELTIGARNLADTLSIRDKIRVCLLGFAPDPGYELMQFRFGRFEFLDPGWVLWRDEYLTAYMI